MKGCSTIADRLPEDVPLAMELHGGDPVESGGDPVERSEAADAVTSDDAGVTVIGGKYGREFSLDGDGELGQVHMSRHACAFHHGRRDPSGQVS
jgi:hypothetical protein